MDTEIKNHLDRVMNHYFEEIQWLNCDGNVMDGLTEEDLYRIHHKTYEYLNMYVFNKSNPIGPLGI